MSMTGNRTSVAPHAFRILRSIPSIHEGLWLVRVDNRVGNAKEAIRLPPYEAVPKGLEMVPKMRGWLPLLDNSLNGLSGQFRLRP